MNRSMTLQRRGPASAVLALALVASCGPSPAEIPFAGILILSVDCMRADRLSCYGYPVETTPHIDALARDGIRFNRCYAQSNWTKPSVASLFTGQYVREHGVTIGSTFFDSEGNPERLDKAIGAYPLPQNIPTLAESMGSVGLFTVGVVENSHINPAQGFGRGFDFYARRLPATPHFRAKVPLEEPWFGYLHLIGPHDPYQNAGDDKEGFHVYRSRFLRGESDLDFGDLAYKKRGTFSDGDVERVSSLYDAELAYYDGEHVGPLLDWLRDVGLYDEMLIIVTSDHGEELYDHKGWAHGHALHEEVIHVPLIIKLPLSFGGLAPGSEVNEVVESIDLFPTLCHIVNASNPGTLSGESLLPLLLGERAEDPRSVAISEHAIGRQDRVLGATVVDASWKLVERYPGAFGKDRLDLMVPGESALFELRSSEAEWSNLLDSTADVAASLRAHLTERLGDSISIERAAPDMVPLDEAEVEELRGLGYIDSQEE